MSATPPKKSSTNAPAQPPYSPRSLELARQLLDPKPNARGTRQSPAHRPRLLSLPLAQLAELVEWLVVDQSTYDAVEARLRDLYQVQTSSAALSSFWTVHLTPLLLDSSASRKDGSIQITVRPATANAPAQVTVRSAAPVTLESLEGRK